jgi:membrane-bound lytic murein transglycosylase B
MRLDSRQEESAMRRSFGLVAAALFIAGLAFPAQAQSQAGFQRWVANFWPSAQSAGISRSTYERGFAGVRLDPAVLEKARYQPEFVRPLWDYVDSAVSEKRLENGKAKLRENRRLLDALERTYGVDRHILVAIWGMESSYGEVLDNPKIVKSVIQSLATLAYADRRRARFGRQQLLAALKILQRGDVSPSGLTGSWAGAMGHTQFIPTTYNAYAVDFDGGGRRNIWTSPADALASAAHYLKKSGWVGGKTWGYEVVMPRRFDYRLADGETTRTLAAWQKLGIRRVGGKNFPRPSDRAELLLPGGANGPAFLLLRNHFVIKRYNNATSYALAIGHLADRLRGGGAFAQAWPRSERPLSKTELRELQSQLARAGHYKGSIDGKIGPMSRAAIRAYQVHAGLAADGYAGAMLLNRLRGS